MGHEYGRMYWFTSPAALGPAIYGHATMTRCIHDSAPAAIRREAAALASQSAALLCLLAHRLQKRPASVMYLSAAAEPAVEAHDRSPPRHALVALPTMHSPATAHG